MNIYRLNTLMFIVFLAVVGVSGKSSSSFAHTEPISDRGDLVVQYKSPQAANLQEVYNSLLEVRFYDELVADLNKMFSLHRDITITFDECHEENAFYVPEEVQVIICYELIDFYAQLFYDEYQGSFDDEVIFASYFTFLHELGHAFVDQLQLPIITKEEDVVDAFATFMLVTTQESDAVYAGIEQFDVDSEEEAQLEELPFWDEHSLSEQRFFSVACLVYGSNPGNYQDLIGKDFLPLERAEQCKDEYTLAENSWNALLAPYLK